jgi:hypothetical protein
MKKHVLKLLMVSLMLITTVLAYGQTEILNEDFSESLMPPTGWSIDQGTEGPGTFGISDDTHAGGEAPQGYINGWPQTVGTTRLVSPVLDASSYAALQLEFKHSCNSASWGSWSWKIETTSDGGATWNEVWSYSPTTYYWATTSTVAITNDDLGSANFQFCLTYEATAIQALYHGYFDDFVLTGSEGPGDAYTLPFTEDFTDGACPAEDWTVNPTGTTNWQLYNGNSAGGVAPEGKYYGWPGVLGTTRMISPVITTAGYESLLLDFKHRCQGGNNADYSFKIETTSDGGATWNEVWSVTPEGSWAFPREESIPIANGDVGADNFQFCLTYVSTTYAGAYHYNFDDFSLTGTEAPTGYPLPFTEDFAAGEMPPTDWLIDPAGTTNWQIGTGTYAGGTAPEGYYYGWPQLNGTTRLISPLINTTDVTKLQLDFRHKCQGANNSDYSWKIETTSDGGTTWNEVFSVTPNGSWPSSQAESITIENADVGSGNFQFCLSYVSTTTNGSYHYNFDDFSLTEVEEPVGYPLPFSEDFAAGEMPPTDWSIDPAGTTNWVISTDYAGGEAPEGKFYGWPGIIGTTRLISPVINTTDVAILQLDFKHKCQGANNSDYSFKIETTSDGGATWNEVWSVTPAGSWAWPREESFLIINDDVGFDNFQFCLSYVSTTYSGAYHYNFDDFLLTGDPELYTVTFNVEDDEANPLEGAVIALEGNGTMTTDASGHVVFANLFPGTYTYDVNAIGFQQNSGSVTLTDEDVVIDAMLEGLVFVPTSLNFDGDNEYVQTSYPGVLGAYRRTFQAWIYLDGSSKANKCILDYGANTDGKRNTFMVNADGKLAYLSGTATGNLTATDAVVPANSFFGVLKY